MCEIGILFPLDARKASGTRRYGLISLLRFEYVHEDIKVGIEFYEGRVI